MSVTMHSKLLEEISNLIEQFSRLTLSDEITEKSPVVNVYKNVFAYDEMYKEVNKLLSETVNEKLDEVTPTRADVMSLSNVEMTNFKMSTGKTRIEDPLSEDVNNNANHISNILPCLSDPLSDISVCEHITPEFKIKPLPSGVEVKDGSSLGKSLKEDCTNTCDITSDSHGLTFASKLIPKDLDDAFSGDCRTPERIYIDSSTNNSYNSESNCSKESVFVDVIQPPGCSTPRPFSKVKVQSRMAVKTAIDKNKTETTKFYAVALPKDVVYLEDVRTLIYIEFKDALKAVKTLKGSRFKEFADIKDALEFASARLEEVPPKAKLDDDGSTLRSATSQELCQLRKSIERGDEIGFVNTVWSNPKILVGSCDTPSIMQEGMRYNALHVAAKSNKPYICQLVLDTIENPKFLEQIYPLKTEVEREKIVYRLLDLYINTPDKKTGDTPLHYASKFGCVDCVKVLLAHPLCVPDRRNVAGFTPREIICSRLQPKPVSLVEDIEAAFKGLLYIPLLRSQDNDGLPFIGKPCTCREIIESTNGAKETDASSAMSLKAFVGPMAPEIAEQFYFVLKKPSSSQVLFYNPEELKLISEIRFSDRERGLERIGRWLADDLEVPWHEYFPFLNSFTNLALDEGLRSLENHLKNQVPYESREEESIFLVHQYPAHINPLAHYTNVRLERKRAEVNCNEIYSTPPSSPVKNLEDCFTTPPASPLQYDATYLQGTSMSKLDVDVLHAIGDATVSAREYPYVSKWKSVVESKLETCESGIDSLSMLASVSLPRLHLSDKICTPKRTLLNKGFCIESAS